MKNVLLFCMLGIVSALPAVALAAGGIVPCDGADNCDFNALISLAQNIINFLVMISVYIATGMFAYAGFLYFTAMGDTGKIGKAHKIFGTVALGLVVILVGWLIVDTILKVLTNKGIDDRVSNPSSSYHINIDTSA